MKMLNEFRSTPIIFFFIFILVYNHASANDDKIYTWESCVKTAFAHNPGLRSSREAINQKRATRGRTRSYLFPQISATGSGEKMSGDAVTGPDTTRNYSYGLSARQLLFDGFKSVYDLKSADADIYTARYDYSMTSATIMLNLKKAFITLMKDQEMIIILKEIRGRRKHIMDLVDMKYQAGSEHRGSSFAARADYLQSQADIKSATRDVSLSKKTLCYLMGLNESSGFSIEGDMIIAEKYKYKPDFATLLLKNPTYLKSLSASNSALLNLKSAKLALSPKLYGTASIGKSGDSLDNMSGNWSLGFEITAPLFEGGDKWYAFSKANSEYRQSRFDERSVKNEVMRSMEESWNSLRNSIDDVTVQKAVLAAALERSKIGETQYSIGTLGFDNWTIIESNLANTKKSYLEACSTALIAEAQWIQSTGGTLDNESKK